MSGNWQGPASFEHVLQVAAVRAQAQEQNAKQVKERRSAELQQMAAQMDAELDRRRKRKERVLTWDWAKPIIEQMTADGISDALIAKELSDQGFITCRREVYRFKVDHGLRIKSEPKPRPSKLDPYVDLILELKNEGKSLNQIAIALRTKVTVTPSGIGDFIKSRGIA
jgi:hypothetical protein